MISRYCWRLIVTHRRKLKQDQNLGQYSEVHKYACVNLKIKPDQLFKGALYRKMMHVFSPT